MKTFVIFFCSLFFTVLNAYTQKVALYQNAGMPISVRVHDLLSRMTPQEKFWQLFMIPGDLGSDESKYKNGLFGFQVSTASQGGDVTSQLLQYGSGEDAVSLAKKINAIQKYFVERTRLGIPMIAFDEALHGLVRSGATSFPQAIGLAASWDTLLMHEVATAIAIETKSRGIRQILTPVINIAGDVRWGRTEETYGEDPFLTSEMGVAFVQPFEKLGIITTPKHFIANVGDGGRDSYPIYFNDRLLEEIYLPPFKALIERGGSRSIMTSYNSLNGIPSTANDWLLNKTLKNKWQFKGFVISDASAVGGANVLHNTAKDYPDAGKKAITNGLDVIFQTDYQHHQLFIPPFMNGDIDKKRIDDAVTRVLTAKFELGLFENPYVSEKLAEEWTHQTRHKSLAKKAALESIVLLKNEKQALPISNSIHSIAIIGKDAVEARLGGYSGSGNGKVNILEGIKEKLHNSVSLEYAPGVERKEIEWQVIPTQYLHTTLHGQDANGLKGEYFTGLILDSKPLITRLDPAVNFHWTLFGPDSLLNKDHYSVRWTGKLTAPESGVFKIGLEGNDGFRLYLDNVLLVDQWKKQTYTSKLVDFVFQKDKQYDIRVEFYEPVGNAHLKLIWNVGIINHWEQKIVEAVALAQKSDASILVAGIEEGEFQDRAMLGLPGHQEELIKRVAALGKPVIVILIGGSAITMNNWLDKVSAVLDVWYPGEEGGHAVADILFGDYNPAGRLPITFPISEAQLPLVYNHKPTGRGDDYINVSGLPLFPFGFGLSYTNFHYSNLLLDKQQMRIKDSIQLHFSVTNTGSMDGDEVVQLYIRDILSSVARPVLELKGFQRIHLKKGETKKVAFTITASMLEMLNEKMQKVVEPGDFRIMVGASSRELWLKETMSVTN